MNDKGNSIFASSLIWFGAAVSIVEILTGTYFAPLGFQKGFLAILIGHLIGGLLMFFAGLIGAKTRLSAMNTVKRSFGYRGGILFAVLNVVQLVGWTSIMIYDGSLAAFRIADKPAWIWALIMGVLIILWIVIGVKNLEKLNIFAMSALFILTLILFKTVIMEQKNISHSLTEAISFGACVELAAAMPLSWLPVISDYTKDSHKPFKSTLISVLVYNIVSIWMYTIGILGALHTGSTDITLIMIQAGLGTVGLLIVLFSTVTTTFLDAFSAGVSAEAINLKLKEKPFAIITTVIGTIGAIFFPMDDITDFLFFIGSVFAPMIAIVITDYFILKKNSIKETVNYINLFVWVIGFIIYRMLLKHDLPFGNTFPDIIITVIITLLVNKFYKKRKV